MDSEGICDGLSAERKVEIRVRKNGRKDEVIVEKSAAEGLPQGWIKKLVITNRKGRKVRRDPYFIDPKSEYIFQSLKDASRYVESGHIGYYARRLKESNIEDDGKTVVPLGFSELKRVTRSQAKASNKEEECDLKRKYLSSSEEETVMSRLSSASSQDSTEKRSNAKVKKNEVSNNSVARRASKRLAGKPTPELKSRKRLVPPDAGPVNQEVTKSSLKPNAASNNCMMAQGTSGCGDEKKMETMSKAELNPDKEEMSPLSRQTCDNNDNAAVQRRNRMVSKESPKTCAVKGASSEVVEKNTNNISPAFDSTLAHLWKDPCIAFAIKTLTGESPDTGPISSSSHPNPGNVNIWEDPCIDFAIKTLTGAIPVVLEEADAGLKSAGARL